MQWFLLQKCCQRDESYHLQVLWYYLFEFLKKFKEQEVYIDRTVTETNTTIRRKTGRKNAKKEIRIGMFLVKLPCHKG